MCNFALEKIEKITGEIEFYKLIYDGKCEFDEFWAKVEKSGNLKRQLNNLQTIMQAVSDNQLLPGTKFKDITPDKVTIKEYEIKTKNLRVYLFFESDTDRVIVCGGKKTTQKKDIKRFQRIKKQYFEEK